MALNIRSVTDMTTLGFKGLRCTVALISYRLPFHTQRLSSER